MKNMKRILIIDSANLYHSNKYDWIKGSVNNLVEPFLEQIDSLVKQFFPDVIVLCNDEYKSKYRMELTKNYKGQRLEQAKKYNKKEQQASDLVKELKKKLKLFKGVFVYGGVKDVEADDIMSILYHDKRLQNCDIKVISQDKDLLTTVDYNDLYDWKKERYKTLEDKLNFTKNEWVFFQSVQGDSSDSVDGVSGVGAKTAEKLVRKYKTISNLLQSAEKDLDSEDVKKDWRLRKALERILTKEGKEEFKLSYHLVKIMRDKTLLEDYQEKEYEQIIQDIVNFKKPSDKMCIPDELEDFLFEVQAFKASDIIKEINTYIS